MDTVRFIPQNCCVFVSHVSTLDFCVVHTYLLDCLNDTRSVCDDKRSVHPLCHEMDMANVQQQNSVMLARICCSWMPPPRSRPDWCLSAVGLACLALPSEEMLRLKKNRVKMQKTTTNVMLASKMKEKERKHV